MRFRKKLIILLTIFVLVVLALQSVKTGWANINYYAANFYYAQYMSSMREEQDGEFLQYGQQSNRKALKLDSCNANYRIFDSKIVSQAARDQQPFIDEANPYTEVNNGLITALRCTPTHSEIWMRLTYNLLQQEGTSVNTLMAFDSALKYGPNERSVQLVNALITLYYWDYLSNDRRQQGWTRILKSMQDPKLAKKIRELAQDTDWSKQLERSLQETRRD